MNGKTTATLISAGSVGAALAAYTFLIRPWHLGWGATEAELQEPLPGDDVVPNPTQEATHAITINAPGKRCREAPRACIEPPFSR